MQPNIQPAEIYAHAAFIEACEKGDLGKVNALIVGSDRKALDGRDEKGRNALHFVAIHGMVPEIEALIKKGVVPFQDDEKKYPLDLALKNGKQEAGGILNQYDLDRKLQDECLKNDYNQIKELIKNGADPKYRNGWFSHRNALHISAMIGHVDSMAIFINEVDVNARDDNGSSALHLAAKFGKTQVIEFLIKVEGIDLDARDNKGKTPLHIASVEAVKAILKTGTVNLELTDKYGYTPILAAIANDHIKIFEALRGEGARVDVKNNEGETALHFAAKNGNTQIFNLLKDKVNLDATQLAILEKQAYDMADLKESAKERMKASQEKVREWLEKNRNIPLDLENDSREQPSGGPTPHKSSRIDGQEIGGREISRG